MRAHGDRVEIVLPVVVDGGVRGAGFERGEIERGDLRPLRDVVRRDVAPVRAAVGGGLDQAVVGADPDFVVGARRWRDRVDDAVAARGGVRDRHVAVAVLRAFLLAGEVGADRVPVLAFVGRAEQHLRARVERVRRVRGECDRRDPRVAVFDVGRPLAVCGRRPRRDVLHFAGARVPARDARAQAGAVDDVRVFGIGNVVVALVAADRVPVAERDRAVVAAARDADGAGILLAGVDPVREAVVGGEVVELAGRLVVPVAPVRAAVDGDDGALVARGDHVARQARVDPEVVVVVAAGRALEDRVASCRRRWICGSTGRRCRRCRGLSDRR